MRRKAKVKFEFEGRQTLQDENGNEIKAVVIAKKFDSDVNWHKVWLDDLARVLNLLGDAKIGVFSHVLENITSDNLFIGTHDAISKKTKVHSNTVKSAINLLLDCNFMTKIQAGVYQINPDIIASGSSDKRAALVIKYGEIKEID